MFVKHTRLLLLMFAFLISVNYRQASSQLREPFLEHITVEQGLSQSSVYCILQDKLGFLWFGTGDGLNKYDGYELTTYRHHQSDTNSLSDNTIRTLMEDRDGNLWIGTAEGLNRYNPQNGKYSFYQLGNSEALLQDSKGRIWSGGSGGLLLHDSVRNIFQTFQYPTGHNKTNEHRSVKALFEDRLGNIWIGTIDGIEMIDRSGEFHCNWNNIEEKINTKLFVSSFAEANDGNLWIATYGGGLLQLNQQTGAIQQIIGEINRSRKQNERSISSLCFDGVSTIWVGMKNDGVMCLNLQTGKFSPLINSLEQSGLFTTYDNRVIVQDRSGLLWIGTDGDGVYKVDTRQRKFKHISAEVGNTNSLSGNFLKTIYEDKQERVWIGTYEHGLTMWEKENNTFKHFLNKSGRASDETVYAITEDSAGTIWIGTETGLAHFEERTQQFVFYIPSNSQPVEKVTALLPTTEGNLWVRMISNLYRFHVETKRIESIPMNVDRFPSLKSANIVCIFEDSKGILWFGTYDGGLNRYDPHTQECITYLYDKMNQNSLSQNMVKVIYETHDGALWIGTGHGLNKFDRTSGLFTRYFEEDGLPSAYIYGILEDAFGNLWLSTNKGISKFNPTRRQFKNYGVEDGLQSNEFNSGACFKNRNGEMYFGGINGFNVFHPDSVRDNPIVPHIVLTGYKKLDLPVDMEGEISTIHSIRLDYEEGIFSLRFSALEYSNPKKNQYAYLLEGFEQNWVYSGTRREVRYTHLDPGDYTFRVKGSNNDGVWSEEGIAIRVVVVPPFWRTWWFLSVSGILLFLLVAGSIRFFEMKRVRQQMEQIEREREMERERSRISQDMHDEIGASLTQIAILSEIARRELDDRTVSERHLQKISNTARNVVDSIGEIIWAINPKNDTLDNLLSFIREYVYEFFEGTEIQCKFEIPVTIQHTVLTGEQRRNIFLVVKESLNNILKHAGAKEVGLHFSTTVDSFSIVIQDNGKGFCQKEISELSNGLNNMKRRMETIGGTFSIESVPNIGTTVKIHFDVNVQRA